MQYYPIWTADERILIRFGATLKEKGVSLGGFGGKTNGNLYELKNIMIGGLIFSRLDIIACNDLKNSPFQMILSATMFTHLIYEVDAKNWKFNVDIPDEESNVRNLQIRNKSGQLQVLCSSEFAEVE